MSKGSSFLFKHMHVTRIPLSNTIYSSLHITLFYQLPNQSKHEQNENEYIHMRLHVLLAVYHIRKNELSSYTFYSPDFVYLPSNSFEQLYTRKYAVTVMSQIQNLYFTMNLMCF